MIDVKETVTIDRSIDTVWDFIMNPDNQARWQQSVLDVRTEPEGEPTGLGTRYVETRQLLGKTFENVFEVSEFNPPLRSAIELVRGPITGGASFDLEAAGDKTNLTMGSRLDTGSFFKVADPALRAFFQRELVGYVHNVKMLVESDAKVG